MLKPPAALKIHSNSQLRVKSETQRQHMSILVYWGFVCLEFWFYGVFWVVLFWF